MQTEKEQQAIIESQNKNMMFLEKEMRELKAQWRPLANQATANNLPHAK